MAQSRFLADDDRDGSVEERFFGSCHTPGQPPRQRGRSQPLPLLKSFDYHPYLIEPIDNAEAESG